MDEIISQDFHHAVRDLLSSKRLTEHGGIDRAVLQRSGHIFEGDRCQRHIFEGQATFGQCLRQPIFSGRARPIDGYLFALQIFDALDLIGARGGDHQRSRERRLFAVQRRNNAELQSFAGGIQHACADATHGCIKISGCQLDNRVAATLYGHQLHVKPFLRKVAAFSRDEQRRKNQHRHIAEPNRLFLIGRCRLRRLCARGTTPDRQAE